MVDQQGCGGRRGHAVRRLRQNVPRRTERQVRQPDDRSRVQHASSRRPHGGQRRLPSRGEETRRAGQRPWTPEASGVGDAERRAAGRRRCDIRQDLVGKSRRRDDRGRLQRPGPHGRRRHRSFRARARRAHGRFALSRDPPAHRSAGRRLGGELAEDPREGRQGHARRHDLHRGPCEGRRAGDRAARSRRAIP